MKLSDKQITFTLNIANLIRFAASKGYGLTFGHAWRTIDDQQRLVNIGLSQTMKSNHLHRLAVDFNVFKNGQLVMEWKQIKTLGDYWESLHPNNRWGGDWNGNDIRDGFIDTPHFEMKP